MRPTPSPARPPASRRSGQRGFDQPRPVLAQLRRGARVYKWHIAGAIGVCLVATVIGLFGPTWLAPRNASFTGPRIVTAGPAAPVATVCGNKSVLGGGPPRPPVGAVVVRAGNDAAVNFGQPGATYWFAPGPHTLGGGPFTQIIPGARATFLGAPGAVLNGRHVNLYAFGGYAPGVTVSYLTVINFGTLGGNDDQGVVNHNSSVRWTIDHSTIADNAGAGAMVGTGDRLAYNCLADNQQYGFNAYSPVNVANITITHNEIVGNDTYNWEKRQPGCGCTGGGKFWDVNGAVVTDNWVHGNHSVGLWADTDNRNFDIEGNYIADNYGTGVTYEISYNALIKNNTFARNGLGDGPTNPGFPTGAIYISESGSDSRVPGSFGSKFSITENTFTDNWGGVILWENANRFCNSPANTSSGACTLVDPAIGLRACNPAHIASQPYYADCRWKTQNISVDHNVFNFNPQTLGPTCTAENECGFNGLFSEYGSYPAWSPYKAATVEKSITFQQGNRFWDNIYNGPWNFMVYQQGTEVDFATWQGGPYHQDEGSAFNPADS
jgi:hypothetical protein